MFLTSRGAGVSANPSRVWGLANILQFARIQQHSQCHCTGVAARCREIVLATNIAETSITISGIRCVIEPWSAKRRGSLRDSHNMVGRLGVCAICLQQDFRMRTRGWWNWRWVTLRPESRCSGPLHVALGLNSVELWTLMMIMHGIAIKVYQEIESHRHSIGIAACCRTVPTSQASALQRAGRAGTPQKLPHEAAELFSL